MIILGLTSTFSEDPAAALIVDGKLVAMVEEERLIRLKHAPRMAPERAADYCLSCAGIRLEDVDFVAIGFSSPREIFWDNCRTKVGNLLRGEEILRSFREEIRYARLHSFYLERMAKFLHPKDKVVFVRHHLAHAASTYSLSGFKEANIISLDGSGGQDSGLLAVGRDGNIEILETVDRENSYGEFYERITGALGFRMHNDEGKVMGLAAYGDPKDEVFPFFDWNRSVPHLKRKQFAEYLQTIEPRKREQPPSEYHQNIAARLQFTLEEAVKQIKEYLYKKTGIENLCMAGGTALNCSMNGKLLESGHVNRIFIQPAAGDAGSALGAAAEVYRRKSGKPVDTRLRHAYWGPEYDNGEIEKALKISKVPYEKCDDVADRVAELLAQDKIVGWHQGRMEVGPRALGGRSILANPSRIEMKDKVNNFVKFREPWRPFAPSMLAEESGNYVTNNHESPFMILAFQARKEKVDLFPAAIHVDNSCRPQTVEREVNPKYYDMIAKFRDRVGIPIVLNTSFNVAGQPIVCRPIEAISTFYACGLDALAIGDFLLTK